VADLRESVILVLIVAGALLRMDALLMLYMRRRTTHALEGATLAVVSPVVFFIVSSVRGNERWKDLVKGGSSTNLTLALLGLLVLSQVAASWVYVNVFFVLDLADRSGAFFGPGSSPDSFSPPALFAVISLYSAILLSSLVLLLGRRRTASHFGTKGVLGTTAVSLALMVLIQVLIAFFVLAIEGAAGPSPSTPFERPDGDLKTLMVFVPIVMIAPLLEEMLFRGALQGALSERLGRVPAVVIASIAFAVSHMDPASMLPIFLLGLLLGWTRERSRSIIPAVLLQSANNAIALSFLLI